MYYNAVVEHSVSDRVETPSLDLDHFHPKQAQLAVWARNK